jgi:hypothetical protein
MEEFGAALGFLVGFFVSIPLTFSAMRIYEDWQDRRTILAAKARYEAQYGRDYYLDCPAHEPGRWWKARSRAWF